VVILWARLGTPPNDRPPKPDGTPYRSGTEWEFWDALNANLKNSPGLSERAASAA